ncbi:STAS domain-containing protein [Modestobacter sp. URMC 112]
MTEARQLDDPTTFDVQATAAPAGWVVTVRGDVDAGTAPRLGDLLLDVLSRPGTADVVLDLREVTFLDSAGLTALVATHQAARRAGRLVHVVPGTARAVVRPLQITGLDTVLDIVDAPPGDGARTGPGGG